MTDYVPLTGTWDHTYDSDGLRSAKTAPDATTTEFTWDRSSGLPLLLAQHDQTATTYLIYGPGGTPLYQVQPDGSPLYLHTDHLGSIRLTTDATGAEHARYAYSSYGTPTNDTTPTGAARPLLTFAGQYTDTETGFQYLRARHYDPTTGQFLTRDPLTHSTEAPYNYANNNPVNNVDPTGFASASSGSSGADASGSDPTTALDYIAPGMTYISIVVCVLAMQACVGLTIAALVLRIFDTLDDKGWEEGKDDIIFDVALTLAFIGLGKLPALGRSAQWADDAALIAPRAVPPPPLRPGAAGALGEVAEGSTAWRRITGALFGAWDAATAIGQACTN